MSQEFWLVWRDNGGYPTVKHFSEGEARTEAERLVRYVGGIFHVLKVVGSVQNSDVVWTNFNDVPF